MPPYPATITDVGEKQLTEQRGGRGQGTAPGCFGSTPLTAREVTAEGGTGQGFKDPESQPRAPELPKGLLPPELLTPARCTQCTFV